MTSHRVVRGLMASALVALLAALAPAMASAAPEWTRLADPPGAGAFTTVSGVPYVAYESDAGVRVARLIPSGDGWRQVGAPIHHTSGARVFEVDLAQAPDNRLWVTWTESDSDDTFQVRVARLDGSIWREVVGGARPINYRYEGYLGNVSDGREPHLAFFGGTTYVVYGQNNPAELVFAAVRLRADGSAWDHIDPSPTTQVNRPRAAVAGGRLFAAGYAANFGGTFVFRLNTAGTGWERISDPGGDDPSLFGDVADLGGTLGLLHLSHAPDGAPGGSVDVHALREGDAWQPVGGGPVASSATTSNSPESLVYSSGTPYAAWVEGSDSPRSVEVARVEDGGWSQLPSPSTAGVDSSNVQLAKSSTGVYAMWGEASEDLRVAKLGEPVVTPPPDDGGDDGSGDGDEETPGAPPEPPTPTPTGHCSNAIKGTALGDVLRGTALSDSISGGAGRDDLFGLGGDDCLFGGDDSDLLSGGAGGDTIFGGNGADVIRGGRGEDDLNGRAGNDLIFGGPGQDAVGGGRGNDRIDIRGGGSDVVACGSGRDVALVDRSDGTRGCERVIVTR